ncbi:uncharacterized protein [Aegilops tauschii subsp. strangulata]|uniref:uncharacterized protein n=1 Tax=Aegilops tauschii subsp. strangulata TaxID=200361 RepID=UPI003CC8D640
MALIPHGGGAGGSATMAMPMLTANNYMIWAIKAQAILDVHTVWEAVAPGDAAVNAQKDKTVRALLLGALPKDVLLQVSTKLTAREVWDSLKVRFIGADRVRAARLATLRGEFDRLKMADGEELDVYSGRLAAMAARYANLGEMLGDAALVKKQLDTLPDRLFPVVAGIEQFHDVTTMVFDERVRRRRQDNGERADGQLQFTAAQWWARERQHGGARDGDDGRGVASGSGGNRRRRCYKCGEHGHFRRECPQLSKGPAAEQALLAGANIDDDGIL